MLLFIKCFDGLCHQVSKKYLFQWHYKQSTLMLLYTSEYLPTTLRMSKWESNYFRVHRTFKKCFLLILYWLYILENYCWYFEDPLLFFLQCNYKLAVAGYYVIATIKRHAGLTMNDIQSVVNIPLNYQNLAVEKKLNFSDSSSGSFINSR